MNDTWLESGTDTFQVCACQDAGMDKDPADWKVLGVAIANIPTQCPTSSVFTGPEASNSWPGLAAQRLNHHH